MNETYNEINASLEKVQDNQKSVYEVLKFRGINKIYPNGVQAVFDFNLEVQVGEFIVLVGPSGCGKSTTIRMIAGLEDISSGELLYGDRYLNDVSPKDRDIAMVFQNYALYAHMTVYHNMAFSLMIRKENSDVIHQKVMHAADILGLRPYLNRRPAQLSGGQRQRVAIGRAIVRDPKVFLLDEPLSNLDAKLRGEMRKELKELHARLGTTMLYVTHDQIEALTLADRIVIMDKGYIQQVGTPVEVYTDPTNLFVANFIGMPAMNVFDVKIDEKGCLIVNSEVAGFKNSVIDISNHSSYQAIKDQYLDKKIVLGVRPEHVSINKNVDASNLRSVVTVYELLGANSLVYLKMGHRNLISKISYKIDLEIGEEIGFDFSIKNLFFFDKETGARIR